MPCSPFLLCKRHTNLVCPFSRQSQHIIPVNHNLKFNRHRLTVYSTVAHNCRVKSKSLASKAKVSRQKQKSRVKSKSLASKAKVSRQKQKSRVKSKTLAAKAKRSPQKQNARRKSKTLAAKVRKHSEANASLFILFPFIYGGRIYLSIFDIFI